MSHQDGEDLGVRGRLLEEVEDALEDDSVLDEVVLCRCEARLSVAHSEGGSKVGKDRLTLRGRAPNRMGRTWSRGTT